MPATLAVSSYESLNRRVLLAVELIDPVTRLLVSDGMTVEAEDLVNRPIVNNSGRFVWLAEGDKWPKRITVKSDDLRFAPADPVAPPRPQNLADASASERLVKMVLRPTPAHDLEPGVTAIRGVLYQRLPSTNDPRRGAPVSDATVTLAWRKNQKADEFVAAPYPATTDAAGQFAVFVRLGPKPWYDPDIEPSPMLAVRLEVKIGAITKWTTPNFAFLTYPKAPEGRVPEGKLLAASVSLGWDDL